MGTQNIKELLGTFSGTEGSLLIVKKIYDKIVEESEKALIPRTEAMMVLSPSDVPGSSIDLDKFVENTMNVRLVPEAGEVPLDQVEYTEQNVKPKKYGVAIRVTKELMEDAKWNIQEHQIRFAGKRMGEKENSLTVTALDSASNTVAGGAAITIGNITRGIQYIEDADKEATSYFVGSEVCNDLRNIDTFTEANKFGSNEMLSTGFVGTIYGMKTYRVSTNAGMTTTSSYITDKNWAYAVVVKRPVTVETYQLPQFEIEAANVTMRIAVEAIRSDAICKITTS